MKKSFVVTVERDKPYEDLSWVPCWLQESVYDDMQCTEMVGSTVTVKEMPK